MAKISTRINLWYLISTGLIILTMAVTMYVLFEEQRRSAIDNDLHEYAEFLVTGLNTNLSNMTELFNHLFERKEQPRKQAKSLRFVLASTDSLIYESDTLINLDSLLTNNEELSKTSVKDKWYTITFNETEYRIYSKPIKVKRGKDFQLIVITSLDRLYESLSQLRFILLIICPIALIVAGFVGIIIAKRSLRPVAELTSTAEAISSENLDQRVPVNNTNDELDKLAITFNSMISRIDMAMRSQRRFIADVSHDIRTPLTIIQMELDLLQSNNLDNESIAKVTTRCLSEIERLNDLTDNLLILARADSKQLILNKENIRLDELLLEGMKRLRSLAKTKNITFRMNIDQPFEVYADRSMISRVLQNLLDNAMKYSYQNEIIIADIERLDNWIVLTVNNKGDVIDNELLAKIFDRFNRGDKSRGGEGFGLGLAIVKTLIEVHGGKVTIDSDEIKGTTLKIFLIS
jgi:two-component system, OmpR family, sensor kinase